MTRDLTPLLRSGLYSDVTLRLCDQASRECQLEVRAHKVVLYWSQIGYFRKLIDGWSKEVGTQVIDIYLDFQLYTPEMLRLFVYTIYMDSIEPGALSPADCKLLHDNVLHFYQLAHRFTFDALLRYCLACLYDCFSLETFETLSDYCLLRRTQQEDARPYTIRDDKLTLYSKLVQWYQYCVELPHLPSTQPHALDTVDCSHETPPHQLLMRHEASVENFSQCRLLRRGIDWDRGRVTQHRNMCRDCLFTGGHQVFAMYTVELGGVKRRDASFSCRFTLTREKEDWSLWVTLSQRDSPDDMAVEAPRRPSTHQVRLSLFSKLVQEWGAQSDAKTLPNDSSTQVLTFSLHDESHCYTAQCAACLAQRPVYIFELVLEETLVPVVACNKRVS